MAAMAQIVAALVRPVMPNGPRRITPAPRKPMPLTIWPMMGVTWCNEVETIVNTADPRLTSARVRKPTAFCLRSRSMPTMPPQSTATKTKATEAQGCGIRSCQLQVSQSMASSWNARPGRGQTEVRRSACASLHSGGDLAYLK